MKGKWCWLVLGLAVGGGCLAYVGHRVHVAASAMPRPAWGGIVPAMVPTTEGLSPGDREVARALRILLRRVDSLRNDSTGRRVYDSLVRARPGLLDSARVAEHFYSLQERLNK